MTQDKQNKGRYVGARWGGSYPVRILGYDCKPGDVCTVMSEEQATTAPQWSPVYESVTARSLDKGDDANPAPVEGLSTKKSAARRGKEA